MSRLIRAAAAAFVALLAAMIRDARQRREWREKHEADVARLRAMTRASAGMGGAKPVGQPVTVHFNVHTPAVESVADAQARVEALLARQGMRPSR